MFPLAVNYNADIHDALASLCILDGTFPLHAKHGAPVVCFAPVRTVKFLVKQSTPVLGRVHYKRYLHYVYYVDCLSTEGFPCFMFCWAVPEPLLVCVPVAHSRINLSRKNIS